MISIVMFMEAMSDTLANAGEEMLSGFKKTAQGAARATGVGVDSAGHGMSKVAGWVQSGGKELQKDPLGTPGMILGGVAGLSAAALLARRNKQKQYSE